MMDKSCHSSGEESSAINPNNNNNNNTNNKDHQYLKNLHKLSHKISKPPIRKPFEFDHQNHHHPSPVILEQSQPSNLHHNQQQHQPPVYNVSKSDFRDVVQKLTGSPAHERVSNNNPVQNPVQHQPAVKPQSSRLQRIRPPPLEHVGNRPPPNSAVITAVNSTNPSFRPGFSGNFYQRPLSPLPPLPAVHATAESPISAYMRCFQTNSNSISGPSPRWNSFSPPPAPLPPPPQQLQPPPVADFPAPSSPLPFGCLNSPKSQFPMLSPGFPFSPTNQFGFQQLTPLSPTPPAPSPRWKSL